MMTDCIIAINKRIMYSLFDCIFLICYASAFAYASAYNNVNDYFVATKSLGSLDIPSEETDFYMGMELEIFYNNEIDRNRAIISYVDLQPTKYFSNWVLQDDFSIENCIEYTSYPLSYANMLNEIPKITAFINMTHGHTAEYTGLHIHVSRKSIEKYKPYANMTTYAHHEYLWWKVNNKEYRKSWIKLAGRTTHYAMFYDPYDAHDAHYSYYKHVIRSYSEDYVMCYDPSYYRNRFVALNLLPKKTIEFRMFKSSTNIDKVKQYVDKIYNVITNNDDYDAYLIATSQ